MTGLRKVIKIQFFFQKMVAAKQNKASIKLLIDGDGNRLQTFDQISKETVSFFQKLIGARDTRVTGGTQNILREILQTLPTRDAMDLSKQVTAAEIKRAMFSIKRDKAPGPDEYTSHFFRTAWSIVGAILFFFHTSRLLLAFNATSVTLVPKCQNPSCIKDFRPISCCSIIYRCITKVMANRLKQHMPSLVSSNQSTFIAGRSITDNVLLA